MKNHKTIGMLFLLFVIFSFAFVGYIFQSLNNTKSKLQVHFLDVGQGDAILIQVGNSNSMLIDSGPQNEKVISEIQKFKNIFDRNLNILLATHADADHIGSMKKVIEKFGFQRFTFSGLSSETKIFKDLMTSIGDTDLIAKLKEKNIHDTSPQMHQRLLTLTAGMSIVLDQQDNVHFDVLFPDFDFQIEAYQKCKNGMQNKNESSGQNKIKSKTISKTQKRNPCLKFLSTETNLNSVVGKLTFGSTSFILTGDAPIEVEDFIIKKYGERIHADVLKLGHHGSKTSTSPNFLNVVSPNFAVISAGIGNRYNHPHKIVLDNLNAFKEKDSNFRRTLRTDIDGTISFYSDAKNLTIKTSK
ncbi:MAG: MBL fold metallo-hydrolase [Candidatus Pacebacteria bacterium]|nr:MBL fold metallo-hydrolase [Candidatus Paceibacterota bacterium]